MIYQVGRDATDTWKGTLDEYKQFSNDMDYQFGEDGWIQVHFSKVSELDGLDVVFME